MKKLICIILVALLTITLCGLVACQDPNSNDTPNTDSYALYVPDGAPALAVANLFEVQKINSNPISVTITTGADVQAKVLSEQADAVICPTNMAANLYNKGVGYQLVSANIFGVLYIVGNGKLDSVADLVGNVLHCIGKNNTPQFVLQTVLAHNGIEMVESDVAIPGKVAVKYYNAGSEIIPQLKSNLITYALLGEPAATKSGATNTLDLQLLWKDATGLVESYPQAGLFVKSSIIQSNPSFVTSLLTLLQQNTQFLQENATEVASILAQNGSIDLANATFTPQVLSRCNVRCVKASQCKNEVIAYFEAIKAVNPNFVLPNDNFFASL